MLILLIAELSSFLFKQISLFNVWEIFSRTKESISEKFWNNNIVFIVPVEILLLQGPLNKLIN